MLHANVYAVLYQVQVSPRLNEGNLPRRWPVSVGIHLGHEINRASDPVSRWHLGVNFHLSVLEGKRVDGTNAGTLYWVNNVERRACSLAPPELVICAAAVEGRRE